MGNKSDLKSIASHLGLSVSTVSRILNGKAKQYRISQATIDLVLEYSKKVGYAPNLIAKGLQASKTFTIGLMIPDIANPFFALMAKNIEKAASVANYSILLVDAEENVEKEIIQVRNMISRKVDAVIAAPVGTSHTHFETFKSQNIPLVFVDRYFRDSDIPYITSDNFDGAYKATKLLIDNGHTNIALIRGNEQIEPVIERRKGYIKALEDNNIPVKDEFIIGNEFSIKNGYESAITLFKSSNKPTSILAMSNLIGLGVLEAVSDFKLKIPDDISLIIYDDQPYVSYLNPPITTIKQNSEEIGKQAVEYILKKMKGLNVDPKSIMINTKLISRKSVKEI